MVPIAPAQVDLKRMRLSWPDAVVAALVGAFAVALFLREPGAVRTVYAGAAVGVLAAIARHDFRTLRAPNRVVYPAIAGLLAGSSALGLAGAVASVSGAVIAFGFFLAIAALGRGAMGFGDAKVAAIAGAAVGLKGLLPMLLATHAAGAIVAAVALGFRLRRPRDVVAYTPFLLFGVVVTAWITPTVGPS